MHYFVYSLFTPFTSIPSNQIFKIIWKFNLSLAKSCLNFKTSLLVYCVNNFQMLSCCNYFLFHKGFTFHYLFKDNFLQLRKQKKGGELQNYNRNVVYNLKNSIQSQSVLFWHKIY